MAETLGSLCDKLTIIKLKQYHTENRLRLESLATQEKNLKEEIDQFVAEAISGVIPINKLSFSSNKVYKKEGNEVDEVMGTIGGIFSQLSLVNCELWHEQEKVYEFEKVPVGQKDVVIKQLALLNLRRNMCIDEIDKMLSEECRRLRSY